MKLQKKIAIITGGGSGIGYETCKLFAQEGAHVVVADRVEAAARRVAEEINQSGAKQRPCWWMSPKAQISNR